MDSLFLLLFSSFCYKNVFFPVILFLKENPLPMLVIKKWEKWMRVLYSEMKANGTIF